MNGEERTLVHFVGAGPGAPDLITVRGAETLKRAQVVIYAGSLVNPELLRYCPDAVVYDSAKMTLDEIVAAIVDANRRGLDVVRLHTGDPSVYGAIREQMDALDAAGIRYDACPGVTACFAAAASLRVEYTVPGVSQTLIITRAPGRTATPPLESIESLAASRASMAIYLSAASARSVVESLLKGGLPPETPAAVVYKASWPDEKTIRCRVDEIADVAKENGISKTALILVGDALAPKNCEKSRLYSPDFSTEFRKARE